MTLKRTAASAVLFLASAVTLAVLYLEAEPQRTQERRRIHEPVNERRTVRLPQTTYPRIKQARDEGRVAPDLPMERVILTLNSGPERETDLEKFLAAQQDPSSPHFHEWLTPQQFGERFGAAAADIDVVVQWLQSHGIRAISVSNGRREIEFSGTASQIEEVFHTEIHNYELNGERHIANANDISIPEALSPGVSGVVSLHDFRHKPKSHRQAPAANFTFGSNHAMAPYDFATIYDVAALWNEGLDGTGQTIAVVGRSNLDPTDVARFRSQYGLPANPPDIIVNGPDPGIVDRDEEGEADLDVEWSGAVAKGAKIKFVVSKSTRTDGTTLSAMYIVNNNVAPILTSSFGFCEVMSYSTSLFYASLWKQAAAEGISVFVASGDSGVATCDAPVPPPHSTAAAMLGLSVDGEASTPYNVAVGGSQFSEGGSASLYWNTSNNGQNRSSAKTYIPEVAWNESGPGGLWSSGGGVSIIHATPSWQTGFGVPAVDPGTTDGHHRYVPDVSLTAAFHDGYVAQQDGNTIFFSGTSASAPAFAGIMAIVNQATDQANGNPNPRLYALAAQVPNVFHDITAGDNSVPCAAGSPGCIDGMLAGYGAGPGYDLVTGWGSVDAYVFVHAWAGTTATPPPPTDNNGGTGTQPPPVSGGSSSSSTTAASYHVFPQFADGRLSDGTYYRTTLMISNTSGGNANCTLQLRGATVTGFSSGYSVPANGWTIASTSGTQLFQSGYAALDCKTTKVEAQLLYSYYSADGTKLSEATVFSSPPNSSVLVLADQRDGAQLGIAIANDSDQRVSYTITVAGVNGSGTVTLGPRTSIAKFLNELVPGVPTNSVGVAQISSSAGTASVVGLRFTGSVFTTIPETPSTSATAAMYHIFPQFADGKFSSGSYYRTTRMYINSSTTAAACTTLLQGVSTDGLEQFTATLSPGNYIVSATGGTQTFQSGYVTLQCSSPVDAQELYSYYGADGTKLSEATVFSSPTAKTVQILADSREGAQIGLAIANDSDQANSFSIVVTDANGTAFSAASQTLNPRSSIAKFLTDFVALPDNYVGRVTVSSDDGTVSIIGLRYTGNVFTTIPEAIVQ